MNEMNISIGESTRTQLSILKGKMLMRDNTLYKITDYEIEEVTETAKKTWRNRNPQPKTRLILKTITIQGYNTEGRFLGTFDKNTCHRLIAFFDLYYFRNTWIAFNEALQAFGLEIRKIEVKEEPGTFAELAKETLNK